MQLMLLDSSKVVGTLRVPQPSESYALGAGGLRTALEECLLLLKILSDARVHPYSFGRPML